MSDSDKKSYLDYKKRAPRSFRALDCRVTGGYGAFTAIVVDISRSGALISVLDRRFAQEHEQNQLVVYTSRVFKHFATGIAVELVHEKIVRSADVVRVSTYCGSAQGINLIGVEFHDELTQAECEQLEVEHCDEVPSTERIADALKRRAAAEPKPPQAKPVG